MEWAQGLSENKPIIKKKGLGGGANNCSMHKQHKQVLLSLPSWNIPMQSNPLFYLCKDDNVSREQSKASNYIYKFLAHK